MERQADEPSTWERFPPSHDQRQDVGDEASVVSIGAHAAGTHADPSVQATLPALGDDGSGRLDHFIERNGLRYAGSHLIIDLFDASFLDDASVIELTFRRSIKEAGATLLHMHFHQFSENGGISGVAVLAESHMSIHTWPECGYAAIDVFMCGDADALKVIPILKHAFKVGRLSVSEHMRGVI